MGFKNWVGGRAWNFTGKGNDNMSVAATLGHGDFITTPAKLGLHAWAGVLAWHGRQQILRRCGVGVIGAHCHTCMQSSC
jgi:hypothetical protein